MKMSRILIVDDDPLIRDVLSAIFSNAGNYQTESVADGTAGIEKVKENSYDIVFTDLAMPGISGIDFVKEAVRLRPALPVVVISGNSTLDAAVNAMREGAKDFITKPFTPATIKAVADRVLSEKRLLNGLNPGGYESSIGRLNAELFRKLQEITIFQSISSELDSLYENKEIYEKIVEMTSRLLRVRKVSFGIVEDGVLRMHRALGVPIRDIPLAGSLFERVVRTREHYLADSGEYNPHTGELLASPFFSIPFTINNEVFGIVSLSNKADGTEFTRDEVSLALTFAKKAAQRIENNALYEVFYTNLINTLKSLVISIEARDFYTKQHSERVTNYALQIADAMHLGPEEKDALRFGGYLHDIGKIGVRDTILLKPGRLTPEERKEINLHPVIGANIIKPLRFFPKERELIMHHHENFDGSGYPERLAGDKIPVTARILAVADAYDAMTSSRPYREAKGSDFAVEELKQCSNMQFDGQVVRAFIQTLAEGGEGSGI